MSAYTIYPQPVALDERLECWVGNLGPFRHAFGNTNLGHLLLVAMDTGECAMFYPMQQALKNYGAFASPEEFCRRVMDDPYVEQVICRADDQDELARRLGPLAEDEVYFPVPYPFLGGSGELSTFERGNVWVFCELVGQLQGVEPR